MVVMSGIAQKLGKQLGKKLDKQFRQERRQGGNQSTFQPTFSNLFAKLSENFSPDHRDRILNLRSIHDAVSKALDRPQQFPGKGFGRGLTVRSPPIHQPQRSLLHKILSAP